MELHNPHFTPETCVRTWEGHSLTAPGWLRLDHIPCSAIIPSLMRMMSAVIHFTGWPKPEIRPLTITKSPSVPGSYLSVGGLAFNEVEQALATRRDASTVLNVFRRPIALSRSVVNLVEQCVHASRTSAFFFCSIALLIVIFLPRNPHVH